MTQYSILIEPGSAAPPGTDWYAATNGLATNHGTLASPWDLQTALSAAIIAPGDRIWLRGGIYNGKNWNFSISGNLNGPIVLRNYQDGTPLGERVRLVAPAGSVSSDCILNMSGSYIWVWGIEFEQQPATTHTYLGQTQSCRNTYYTNTSSPPDATMIDAIDDLPQGTTYTPRPGQKVVNCIFHDVRQGISGTIEQVNHEAYGNIHWNVGYDEEPYPLCPVGIATAWNSGTSYKVNDTVSANGLNYVCIQANTNHAPPNNTFGNFDSFWIACFTSQRGHGFPTYFQNQTSYSGTPSGSGNPLPSNKLFKHNVGWGGFTGIFKFYGSGNANEEQSVTMIENTTAMGGKLSTYGSQDDFLFGGGGPNSNYVISGNSTYQSNGGPGQSFCLNDNGSGSCSNITITNNMIGSNCSFGATIGSSCNQPSVVTGNTFLFGPGNLNQANYPSNTYYASPPNQVFTLVRPNTYQPGRCTVVIYNYPLQNTVNVDLTSSGLLNGQNYQVRDAFNFYGPNNTPDGSEIVMTGTFNSASPIVGFPMTGRSTPVQPYGYATKPASETWHTMAITYPKFGIFVVLPT